MVRLPAVGHVGKTTRNPVGRIEHGILSKVRIAEGSIDIGMAEQPSDDAKSPAAVDRNFGGRMSIIPKPEYAPHSTGRALAFGEGLPMIGILLGH